MKAFRFRTMVIAVLVVSGSAVTGIGLGVMLTKVAQTGDKPGFASNGPQKSTVTVAVDRGGPRKIVRVSAPGRGFSANEVAATPAQRAAAAGVRIIHINPQNLRKKPNRGGNLNASTAAVKPLPMWTYQVTASPDLGGGTFTGLIVGRSPFDHGKVTTTIPTQLVPLVININDGINNITYDPTVADPCVPGNLTDMAVITGSPIFTNNNWTMNGINVGTNTQYHDAFQRAQFWSLVGGTPYHLVMKQSTLASQPLSFGVNGTSGAGQNYNTQQLFNGCGFIGVVDFQHLLDAVFGLIEGPLANLVNVGTFPIFVMKNVVMGAPGTDLFANCCVLGFHDSFNVGPNIQIFSPFDLDTTGIFGGGYTIDLAHEIGEAFNDPTGVNPTPPWGNIGQNFPGQCQDNFEVGDPLSPGFGTVTNTFTVVGADGLTYGLQELAFFSWFYGGPSMGAGGKFSNNGSFGGDAILCPPGGTNQ